MLMFCFFRVKNVHNTGTIRGNVDLSFLPYFQSPEADFPSQIAGLGGGGGGIRTREPAKANGFQVLSSYIMVIPGISVSHYPAYL